jgi:hypothetical protein
MRYRFSEKECERIEAWARKTNLHAILTFIESKPRKLEFTRPVLLGSNGRKDILVEGMGTRSSVCRLVRHLDEPFDPYTPETLTHDLRKQPADLSAEIHGTIADQLSRGFERLCFLESTGQCQRGIIRAHVIQEALIREIAIKGHVLQFDLFKRRRAEQEHRNWPVPIGVDLVTTFTGFCSFHDNQIFLPIENGPFTPTPESLFLYAYRALCGRLYVAKYSFEMVKAITAAVRASGQPIPKHVDGDIAGNDLDTEELVSIKFRWDRHLAGRDFAGFDHLAFSCPKTPDIIGASFFAPQKNFDCSIAQDSKMKGPLSWVAMSVVPRKGGGGLVLISSEKNNSLWAAFITSLLAYPLEKRTMAVVNYIVCYFGEQLILAPAWWDKLPEESREALVNAWSVGYYPRYLKRLCDWGPLVPVA